MLGHKIFFVMGVSGSGKTTVGKLLAHELGIDFFDADDFHSHANVEKMRLGEPLTDEDRHDWLQKINSVAIESINTGKSAVIACSALKQKYRDLLAKDINHAVKWICLHGDKALIQQRIEERTSHYMPASLLQSQFDIFEMPQHALMADVSLDAQTIVAAIMTELKMPELGIVGLGVMGTSLARNWAGRGITLCLYNRYVAGSEEGLPAKAIATYPELRNAYGFEDLAAFVSAIQVPRKIFMMIKAGQATDSFIEEITPLLSPGDVLIDGGNSHYIDTLRRMNNLRGKQLDFVGTGVSGGEQGALNGPSIMPSGAFEAYEKVAPLLNAIAAKDKLGNACCAYIGPEGSGHFVKMVHNGMEYAEMQLIAEAYAYLRYVHQMPLAAIADVFAGWNSGTAHSFLLEITIPILQKKEGGAFLIDLILDVAGNKGTGNWATIAASQLGFPASMITSALFARYASTLKETVNALRNKISNNENPLPKLEVDTIQSAYQAARLVNHQQGFLMLQTASDEFGWQLNLSEIARIWTNGCIIRSNMMEEMVLTLQKSKDLFTDEVVRAGINTQKQSLKMLCSKAIEADLPLTCHLSALDYLNTLSLPLAMANIIQAQRDYFGAHTYQKRNDATGAFYHTAW